MKRWQTQTHLEELVGLLPVQPVGYEEGVISVWFIKLTQQFGKASVDVVLAIAGCQALRTHTTHQLILFFTETVVNEKLLENVFTP